MTGRYTAGRPKLLDLYCCAGGAAMGYHRAGFDVVGVDIRPQPRYPFPFIQADVLTLDRRFLRWFDAIHASPPCQAHTALKVMPDARPHLNLIPQTREMLAGSGLPYVIENVVGAPLIAPVMLCGTMFNLGAQGCDLQRHRLFETNVPFLAPECSHRSAPVIGVYGGHARKRSAKHGGRGTRDAWDGGHKAAAAEAMGIDWMTLGELSEAIPPAYTLFIGRQLLSHIEARSLAA